jgi:hypothetical protein
VGVIARLFVWLAFPLRLGLPAATTVVAFVIGLVAGYGSGAYERSFYEATSQIIPVLLLVLAVEARFFRIDLLPFKQLRQSFVDELTKALGENASARDVVRAASDLQRGRSFAYVQQRLVMVLALLTLVAGEVASILVLGQPKLESPALQGLVLGATFAGLGAVTIAALVGPMPLADQPSSPDLDSKGDDEADQSASRARP